MAATSPPSQSPSPSGCQHRLPLERVALARDFAPSVAIPLRFFIFGLICLGLATAWQLGNPSMVLAPYHTPHTVAWTHLFVLGFALSIVMGAAYQIAPVALGVKLHSERLASFHPILHIVGVSLMVPMFFLWSLPMVTFAGGLIIAGALLFAYNLMRTLRQITRPEVVAATLGFSIFWLLLTMALGLIMTIPGLRLLLPRPGGDWLAVHAHMGVGGIFINLIVGLSFQLLPLFTLSSLQSPFRAWTACLGLNLGLFIVFVSIGNGAVLGSLVGGVVIVLALAIAMGEIVAICRHRQRRRWDWGLRMFLVAVGLLLPLTAVGLVAAMSDPGSPIRNFYALLALWGVVGIAIIGMMQKILPFLVWYAVYSPHVGRSEVPSLAGMVSLPLQKITFLACLSGLGLTEASIVWNHHPLAVIGVWLWALGMTAWLLNAIRILSHFRHAQAAPLPVENIFSSPTHENLKPSH